MSTVFPSRLTLLTNLDLSRQVTGRHAALLQCIAEALWIEY